jgi:type I restriction enzyme S subunit
MFGDPVRNDRGWDRPELKKNFGLISTGNTPPRKKPENYSPPFIEWIKTVNIDQNHMYITQASEYLSKTGLTLARTVKKGALLVACIAGSIESIGRAALADRNVAFNQQINAIQPNSDISSIFLYWLFRISKSYIQSFAPKGMKKILTKGNFEKITMIKPPKDMQDRFARIAGKTETIKSSYQNNLAELENFYGALSQKAFKGELDLSRIPLEQIVELKIDTDARESETGPPFFPTLDHEVMSDTVARKKLLRQIFEDYFTNEPKRFLSFNDFWSRVEFNALDYMGEESPPLGLEDYNQIKAWLFDHLKRGEVEQTFNEHENQIKLHSKS